MTARIAYLTALAGGAGPATLRPPRRTFAGFPDAEPGFPGDLGFPGEPGSAAPGPSGELTARPEPGTDPGQGPESNAPAAGGGQGGPGGQPAATGGPEQLAGVRLAEDNGRGRDAVAVTHPASVGPPPALIDATPAGEARAVTAGRAAGGGRKAAAGNVAQPKPRAVPGEPPAPSGSSQRPGDAPATGGGPADLAHPGTAAGDASRGPVPPATVGSRLPPAPAQPWWAGHGNVAPGASPHVAAGPAADTEPAAGAGCAAPAAASQAGRRLDRGAQPMGGASHDRAAAPSPVPAFRLPGGPYPGHRAAGPPVLAPPVLAPLVPAAPVPAPPVLAPLVPARPGPAAPRPGAAAEPSPRFPATAPRSSAQAADPAAAARRADHGGAASVPLPSVPVPSVPVPADGRPRGELTPVPVAARAAGRPRGPARPRAVAGAQHRDDRGNTAPAPRPAARGHRQAGAAGASAAAEPRPWQALRRGPGVGGAVIFDLSVVTDTLKNLVDAQWQNAPLWSPATPLFAVEVTGLSPEAARLGQGAQLSLYLYHVDENNAGESLFWAARAQSAGGPPLRYQPLALDLYYLLSAYAEGNYVHEQQAMSIAMRVFHENPVVRGTGADGLPWEVTLTLERRSYDELSRLWQATMSALRLSAVYRAAVVLIEPEPAPPPAPPVSVVSLAAAPGRPGAGPRLLGVQREVQYTAPGGTTVAFMQDPATVAAGGEVWLTGSGLAPASGQRLILTGPYPGDAQVDVSAWLAGPPQPDSARRAVRIPAAAGAPPAGAPAPGRYSVRLEAAAGVAARVAAGAGTVAFRTAEVPLGVAAGVSPAGGPLLATAASYTVRGTGFVPGDMQVLLGAIPLRRAAAAPAAGEYAVSTDGTTLTLVPPAGLPAGTYQLRVRVAGVESDPALWLAAA